MDTLMPADGTMKPERLWERLGISSRISKGRRKSPRGVPGVKQPPEPDHFPDTHVTFISARLGKGSQAEAELRNHVMVRYAEPLKAYFLGSTYRGLWEADEIVNGFFLDRLQRKEFLVSWRSSGLRLRRWLMNAMCFYLKEVSRSERKRAATGDPDVGDELGTDASHVRTMDRAFRQTIVRTALDAAQASCEADGFALHFQCFLAYHVQNRTCESIGLEIGEPADRVWVMVRTGQRRFVKALRQAIMDDGTPPDEIDAEIRDLLDL